MFQQTKTYDFFVKCALRVNICEVSVFHEMHARLRGPKSV